MGWNALNPPKLSDNPIGHIRLNTVKVCKHPMQCRNPNISYLLWPIRSLPDIVGGHQQPDKSFASTREACPKFRYKYASVAALHANPSIVPTSFTSDHNFPGTLLLLLWVKSELLIDYKGFCNLCQVLTIYTNTGVGNMQVALNNCNQQLSRIMMIDNVIVSRYTQNQLHIIQAATFPQNQIIRMSSDAGTCNIPNVIIPSPRPTLQLQDH
ncbi:hypothetical protein M9H77_04700 [Catharanthus roseus]|uniref:Uncharacterized protein n=1 Tax=Catharanthus roseus TaxID=4058 RepID=A0ACC0CF56_CATRO|nr:hypothetical protein M9H77_04700 [Catharanthus roseus]